MRESPPMADELTITRPDDWHLHVRDGAALAAVVPASARQFGRAIIMPNLKPPVTHRAGGARLPRPHRRGGAGRRVVRAADDAVPDRHAGADEIRRAREAGIAARQALPGRRDDQQRCRRDRAAQDLRRARGDAAHRHAAAGPWRGHRSRRSTCSTASGLPRDPADPAAQRLSGAEDRDGAHHDARGGAVRRRGRRPRPRRRSPRTTCSTTATRSSSAASGRITTACRC